MLNNLIKFINNSYNGFPTNLWVISITIMITRSGAMVLPFLSIYLIQTYYFSINQTSIILSAYGFGAIIGSYVGGQLTNKIGTISTQIISLLLSIPFYFLIPYISNYIILIILLFTLSVINECFSPANSLAIIENSDEKDRIRAFSLNRTAINMGFVISPLVGGIVSMFSYRYLFYANAISCFFASLLLLLFFKKGKEKGKKVKRNISPFRHKLFMAFFFCLIIYTFCFMQFLSAIPLYYKMIANLSNFTIGIIFGYEGVLLFFLEMPLIFWLNNKLKMNSVISIGFLLLFSSYILLAFNHSIFIILLISTLMVISEILILPFLSTITSFLSKNKNEGAYMGLYNSSFSIALFTSPYISSYILSKFGYQILWLSIALLTVISCIGFNIVLHKIKLLKT